MCPCFLDYHREVLESSSLTSRCMRILPGFRLIGEAGMVVEFSVPCSDWFRVEERGWY